MDIKKLLPREVKLSCHAIQTTPWDLEDLAALYYLVAKQLEPEFIPILVEQGLQGRYVFKRGIGNDGVAVLIRHPLTDFTLTLIGVTLMDELTDHADLVMDAVTDMRLEILSARFSRHPVRAVKGPGTMMATAIGQHLQLLKDSQRELVMDVTLPYRVTGARIAYNVGLDVPGGMDVISADYQALMENDYVCPLGPGSEKRVRLFPGLKATYKFDESQFSVACEGWRDIAFVFDYEGHPIDFFFRT